MRRVKDGKFSREQRVLREELALTKQRLAQRNRLIGEMLRALGVEQAKINEALVALDANNTAGVREALTRKGR